MKKRLVWIFSLFIVSIFFIFNKNELEQEFKTTKLAKNPIPSQAKGSKQEPLDKKNLATITKVTKEETVKKISASSFQQKLNQLKKLSLEYPSSHTELIQFIINEDSVTKNLENHKPHSIDERNYLKAGALKVIALKTILEKQTNKETKTKALQKIASMSEDKTLTRIAKAALDAQKEDRPFFKDFIQAINQMNVEE
jgi:hypothetical protein